MKKPVCLVAPALAAAIAAAMTVPSLGTAQVVPPRLERFLEEAIALDQDELNGVRSGAIVVKALGSPDRLEVAVFGIVRIDVPRSFHAGIATDFETSLRNPWRTRLGLFSDPASIADVAAFSLPDDDLEELIGCVPGACKVELSAAAISALRERLDADPASVDSVANAFFRAHMVDYVDAYRAQGNAALVVYDDEPRPRPAGAVFDAILSRSPYMYEYSPSLERYLKNYPRDRPDGIREALFWSQDELPGLRQTLSVTHQMVHTPPEPADYTLVVAKLLYASHYLDGALDLTAIVDQPAGVYLVRLWRLHFDSLRSGPIDLRGRVTGELRERLSDWLGLAKTQSEQAYPGA